MPVKYSSRFAKTLMLSCLLAAAVPALSPAPASACGGFFCSRVPIDQAAERILFVKDGEEMVAHVQIQYTGPSEKFAWIVPVPTPPKLSVGSDQMFQVLRNTTRPQFQLNLRTEGTCKSNRSLLDGLFPAPTAAAGAVANKSSLEVVSRQDVGPYDTAVLKGDSVQVLKDWLKENGYDVPDKVDALLAPYVQNKMYLLALKLRKNFDTGALQPIVMRYLSAKPMIPIQLTAVAATPDMDVQLWILGAHRAIPVNYPHVEINEALIDWVNQGQNYRQVVTTAMNEAGGRGFVTDYAGDSSVMPMDQLDPSRINLDSIKSLKDPIPFAQAVQSFFQSNAAYTSFLSRYITKPAAYKDIDDATFYNQLDNYQQDFAKAETRVNTEAAAKELNETLVTPLKDIRRQFMENPYLTAMFTTLSPEEMTADPMFDFNPQLPKVSQLRKADGVRLCSRDLYEYEAPIRVTTASGLTFMVQQNTGSQSSLQSPASMGLPSAARIQRTASAGTPETISDNTSKIAATLGKSSTITIQPNGSAEIRPVKEGFGCACAGPNTTKTADALGGAGEGMAYASVLLAFAGWRKWRKRK